IPSKALLRPLHALADARAVAGARAAVTGTLDAVATLQRRDSFAHHWDDASQVDWLETSRIELVRGHGRLAGERGVAVTDKTGATIDLIARHAVAICTGSRTSIPPIPGLADARPWTSREATSARHAPRRLAIIGGGVVACEMATAWSQLGAEEIAVIQRGPRLIPGLEPFASEALREALERRGVKVITGTTARDVERAADGSVRLGLQNGQTIISDEVLVAAGREPRTDDLGLETIGLEPGSWLEVDDSMRVTAATGGWGFAPGGGNPRGFLSPPCGQQTRRRACAATASRLGRGAHRRRGVPCPGRRTPPLPIITPSRRSSSPSRRSPRSGSPRNRPGPAESPFGSSTMTSGGSQARRSLPTTTRGGHEWSWIDRKSVV